MAPVAVAVEHLGKKYRIGAPSGIFRYRTLREALPDAIAEPFRRVRSALGRSEDRGPSHIWALDDLSFEVKRGEVVGVIGRNGAGKTTLLKILSRITKPTAGRAELRGRVGSLLEVGTGFHPELSGRDNIYLNGAILGMRRAEIDRRFDEIVEFAGVAKFIDTPVKHFSSGMYVRLAFAVAAHLEPEILLVDEVLAVGDAEFQQKCLGKMRSVVGQGRTILFVSHNMAAIKALCHRAILLDGGRLASDGPVDHVVDRYFSMGRRANENGAIPADAPRCGTGEARIREVTLLDLQDRPRAQVYLGQPFRVKLAVEVVTPVDDAIVEIGLSTLDGTRVTSSFTTDGGQRPTPLSPGRYQFCLDVDTVLLPRSYAIDVGVHHSGHGVTVDMVERALDFSVLNVAESGGDHHLPTAARGFVRPAGRWHSPERISADRVDATSLP